MSVNELVDTRAGLKPVSKYLSIYCGRKLQQDVPQAILLSTSRRCDREY